MKVSYSWYEQFRNLQRTPVLNPDLTNYSIPDVEVFIAREIQRLRGKGENLIDAAIGEPGAEQQRRARGTQRTKDDAEASRLKLQEGMMKYFAVVEDGLGCELENATADQLRKEYNRGRIAKGLWDDRRDFFETSPGEHDGKCPYSRKTLEDREVGGALKQLIREKEIPPEPPRRPRRK